MASQLQSENARRNGAKSRGPVTAAGKSRSSRNATKHGILSKTLLIEGESPRFTALHAGIRDLFKPRNPIEDGLLEDLAACCWRQQQLLSMETNAYSSEINRQDPQTAAGSPATRAANALASISADSRTLGLIYRYESRFDRQYDRTLRRLLDLRREVPIAERTHELEENKKLRARKTRCKTDHSSPTSGQITPRTQQTR